MKKGIFNKVTVSIITVIISSLILGFIFYFQFEKENAKQFTSLNHWKDKIYFSYTPGVGAYWVNLNVDPDGTFTIEASDEENKAVSYSVADLISAKIFLKALHSILLLPHLRS